MVMPFAVPNLSMRVESSGVGRRSRGASNELAQSSGAPGEAVSQRHAFGVFSPAGRFGSNFASATHPFAMPNLPRRVEFWAHYRRSRSVSNESAQLSGCAGRRHFPTACLWRFQPGGTVPPFWKQLRRRGNACSLCRFFPGAWNFRGITAIPAVLRMNRPNPAGAPVETISQTACLWRFQPGGTIPPFWKQLRKRGNGRSLCLQALFCAFHRPFPVRAEV